MSLNSLASSNQVPFFPPGIADHKTKSSFKRPQNVKECKKISKDRFDKPTLNGSSNRRLSKSTPDLKSCLSSGHQIPRHRCDMGLENYSMFKATPLPHYYSPDSLERNRSLFGNSNYNYNTRSLDRLTTKSCSPDRTTFKFKPKTVSKFTPDKPFYPPSKYPNIHDKVNMNLRKLLEAREQYKTPKSRRSLSIQNRNKSKWSRPNNLSSESSKIGGSVPNLSSKKSKNIPNNDDDASNKISTVNPFTGDKDQMDFSPEIGLYRQYNKLDLQDEFNTYPPKQMSASYYYPKPIPNPLYTEYHDKMAQSLYNESSLAAKIHTGSLERATRNNFYPSDNENKDEVRDLDESPTKSYSPLKQCSSFSQDSLDGNRKQQEIKINGNCDKIDSDTNSIMECDQSSNINSEDSSMITESKTYKFHSLTEEPSSVKSETQKFPKSLSTISEKDKTIGNQKENKLSNTDSFYKKMTSDSLLNNSNLSNDLKSKYGDINNEDEEVFNMDKHGNKHDNINGNENDNNNKGNPSTLPLIIIPKTDKFQSTLENGVSPSRATSYNNFPYFPNVPSEIENMSEDEKQIEPVDQYNLDRYIRSSPTAKVGNLQSCFMTPSSMSIHNEFLNEVNIPVGKLDNVDSAFSDGLHHRFDNTQNWKTEECFCIDKPFAGESLVKIPIQSQDHQKPYEIDSTPSTIYNSVDTQISGLDYDLTEKGVNHHAFNGEELKYSQIPRIALNSDISKSIDDSSSEAESSLNGSDDTSYMKYHHNSMHFPQPGMSWVSSPELTIARSDIVARKHRRYLQSDNPLKPLCNVCFKPAYFMERISINNIIFHKMCFLCRKCDTHLSFNNCIIHRRKPYCLVHAKPKIWKRVRSESRHLIPNVDTVSSSKLNQIKERLDNKTNMQKQANSEVKQPKRVFYSGIKSAKDKFLQESAPVKEPVLRQPKRFTPPRQGVTAGVIESEPKPRDPNVVTCGDYVGLNDDLTRLSQSSATKERLAQFKEMQEKSFDKGMVNGDTGGLQIPDIIPVDTKILRNKFLSGSNDMESESKLRKINPSEEIQELARKESHTVYENEPQVRTDVVKSDQRLEEENTISRNKAKELKDLFSNYSTEDSSRKLEKFQMEIGEGGVYESNPKERSEHIVPSDSNADYSLPNDTVKTGLQKIKDLQNIKSQGYQKINVEPIHFDMDSRNSGIYENTPAESKADSDSFLDQNDAYLSNIREKKYANEAKKAYLEKQQEDDKNRFKRDTPQMIDIWKDLCPDSGVFENKPLPQSKDVIRHNDVEIEKLAVDDELQNDEENMEHNLNEPR